MLVLFKDSLMGYVDFDTIGPETEHYKENHAIRPESVIRVQDSSEELAVEVIFKDELGEIKTLSVLDSSVEQVVAKLNQK